MIEYFRKGATMSVRNASFAIVGFFVSTQIAQAAMSSTNFEIRSDTLSTGGSDTSSSASYILRDSVSQNSGSSGSSTSYQVGGGYRSGVFDQIISFDLFTQNSTNEREISALASTTVSMSSTVGLLVGDYVAVVQNRGASQVAAIGKIQSVAVGSIVLDRLVVGSSTPTIDGTSDYLYLLNGSSLSPEVIDSSSVGTGILAFEITVDNDSGYVVQILEDGPLRDGANSIDDVTDGAVTLGSEEYGARSNDSSLSGSTFDTQDTAITTTAQEIVSRSTFAFDDRSFITFNLSASTATTAATYSHTLTIITSGNF